MGKRVSLLLFLFIFGLSLGGLALGLERSKIVIVATPEDPTTLDPAVVWEPKGQLVIKNCYNTLVVMDKESATQVKGELAERWEVKDEGKTYIFYLVKGVKFHDGTELTAEDVKYSIERTIGVDKGPGGQLKEIIKSVEVVDKYTVKFNLNHPAPWFLTLLAQSGASILNSKLVKAHATDKDPWALDWLHDKVAGSGPYKLDRWVHEQQIVLVKNPDYFKGWKENQFDMAIIRTVKEPSERRLLLEKGDVDIAFRISEDDLLKIKDQKGIKVMTQPSLTIFYIGFNVKKGPLQDVRVRKALAYAFDYDAFINDAMRGFVKRLSGPVPSSLWSYDESYPQYKRDIEKAKKLLAEAGYPNGGFTLDFVVETGGDIHKQAALVFQQSVKELGIKVNIQFLSWTTIWAKMSKEEEAPQIFDTHWYADYADVENFLYYQYHSSMWGDKGFNESYYKNAEVDKLLDEARYMTDEAKRKELFSKAIKMIMEDCPAIWCAERLQIVSIRDWLKGYVLNPIYYETPNFYELYR